MALLAEVQRAPGIAWTQSYAGHGASFSGPPPAKNSPPPHGHRCLPFRAPSPCGKAPWRWARLPRDIVAAVVMRSFLLQD